MGQQAPAFRGGKETGSCRTRMANYVSRGGASELRCLLKEDADLNEMIFNSVRQEEPRLFMEPILLSFGKPAKSTGFDVQSH